jgi:hypothetical protein
VVRAKFLEQGEAMENGPKIAIGVTVVLVAAVGIRIGLIYKANHEAGVPRDQPAASRKVDPDDLVFLRKEHPDSLKDARDLIGKTLWVSAGGQMDYYVDKASHVDYAHPVDTLLGAEPVVIRGVFEQTAPTEGRAVMRIGFGDKYVLLAFTKADGADQTTLYALPVGKADHGGYTFYTDEIFFYDDPHQLYSHWGTAMWQHIDKHEAVLGMSENQAMMSLGQVITPHGDVTGNRSVTYDNDGKPVTIQFEDNKATKITPGV